MAATSQSETGHYKNLANFQSLIGFCEALGAAYQPGSEFLSLAALQQRYESCSQLFAALNSAELEWHVAVGKRAAAYATLPSTAARIMANMKANNPESNCLKPASHFLKKLQGKRIVPIAEPGDDATAMPRHISASQAGFDAKLDHFRQLLQLMGSAEPAYVANEPQLQLDTLLAVADSIAAMNHKVTEWGHRRKLLIAQRQEQFYGHTDSMLACARGLKNYIHALYGPVSIEARAVHASMVIKL
jgi:hypothetical protein